MAEAGYSGAPLSRKLGLKDGQRWAFVALPPTLNELTRAAALAECCVVADWQALPPGPWNGVHLFTVRAAELQAALAAWPAAIAPDGMVWVSWPKKAAKVPTDITEDVIRDVALRGPWVDVKVCAVDATWSGLKLVIRKALRPV